MLGMLLWPDLGDCNKLGILACHSHKAAPPPSPTNTNVLVPAM